MRTSLPETDGIPSPGPGVTEQQDPRPAARRRKVLRTAALFAAAWLFPLGAHAAHADWLSLVVLLAGTASLLRAGRTLLDRFMFAAILLAGVVLASGIVFSLWPWGLDPLPVAIFLLSLLVAAHAATGRTPALPKRVEGTDAVILGGAVASVLLMYRPLLGKSLSERLPMIAMNEDRANHFSLFDAIHRVGGFTYFHADQASSSMDPTMAKVYPPGSHFLYTLLDTFARSTPNAGDPVAAYNRYFLYTIFGYGFLVLAVAWAARWIAGPALRGWLRPFVCALVVALLATGQMFTVFGQGHDSAAFGLAVLALAVAVIVRPPRDVREQVLVAAAAVVAVSFVYNLFVVFAAVAVVVTLALQWSRIRRHMRFTVATAVVAVPLVAIPVVGPQIAGFSQAKQLSVAGGIVHFGRSATVVLVGIVLAAALTRTGRRSPAWRALTYTVAISAGGLAVVGAALMIRTGETSYYFEKAVQATFVLALTGTGAIGLLIRPAALPDPRRGRLPRLGASVAAVCAATLLVGGVQWGHPSGDKRNPATDSTFAAFWWNGSMQSNMGKRAAMLRKEGILADGKPTVFLYDNNGMANWRLTLYNAILNRRLGPYVDAFANLQDISGVGAYRPSVRTKADKALEDMIRDLPRPGLRIIVSNRDVADTLQRLAARYPQQQLDIRYMPEIGWPEDRAPADGAKNGTTSGDQDAQNTDSQDSADSGSSD